MHFPLVNYKTTELHALGSIYPRENQSPKPFELINIKLNVPDTEVPSDYAYFWKELLLLQKQYINNNAQIKTIEQIIIKFCEIRKKMWE